MEMSNHFTGNGLHVTCYGDVWTLPSMYSRDGGLLEPSTLTVRIAPDGIACEPLTSGDGADQHPDNVFPVEVGEQLHGWGMQDGESYRLANHVVSAEVLDQLSAWSGLRLPAARTC